MTPLLHALKLLWLCSFQNLAKQLGGSKGQKDWAFPKFRLMGYYESSIQLYGNIMLHSTSHGEAGHKLFKAAFSFTNMSATTAQLQVSALF